MAMKASEKIIDGLAQIMEGFAELQEAVESEYGAEHDETTEDEDDSEVNLEIDAAIVNEMRAAIEAVMENEEYGPEEIASLVSTMTDALEEIDPEVFEESDEEEEEDEDIYDEDLDDDEDLYDEDLDEVGDDFEEYDD